MIFRDAAFSDCDAVARLHALSWRTTYKGILAQDFIDKFAEGDRRRVWQARLSGGDSETQLVRVAVEKGELVGFACVFLDEDERWGALLDNLHVHPDLKGRGIGRQLIAQAASWVIDRRPAGGIPVERVVHRSADGNDVPSMRYVWKDLVGLVTAIADTLKPNLLKRR